jgi:hypothetical protein
MTKSEGVPCMHHQEACSASIRGSCSCDPPVETVWIFDVAGHLLSGDALFEQCCGEVVAWTGLAVLAQAPLIAFEGVDMETPVAPERCSAVRWVIRMQRRRALDLSHKLPYGTPD